MATIPDVQDLGQRPIPRAARGIVSDRSAAINAEADQQFLGSVRNIASGIADREDRFAYAQAKSSLLQADMQARASLKDDPDWATHEQRYTEQMGKALENSNKLIRGNRDRALFDMDAKMDLERGTQQIRDLAKTKEIDWGRSTLDQTLEANRNAALSAPDEGSRQAIIGASKDAIIGAQQKGYLSEQDATNSFQRWRDSYATGSIEMLPPDKRIEALTGKGASDYLQPDVRAKLLHQAQQESKSETIKRSSQAASDALLAKHGLDFKSALEDTKQIDNPEVRDATQSRIEHEMAVAEHFRTQAQTDAYEEGQTFIDNGGKFADMPVKLKERMKPAQVNSLSAYSKQVAGGGTVKTDVKEYGRLSSLFATNPQAFGDADLTESSHQLSTEDMKHFLDLQSKVQSGSLDGKASGYLSRTQVRDDRLRQVFGTTTGKGKTAEKIGQFKLLFDNNIRAIKENTGKEAKAEDAKKILDDMTAEVVLKDTWFNTHKKAYELTQEDVHDVPEQDRNEIIRVLRQAGKPITDIEIARLYKKGLAR